jgi:hypothetical protein
MLLGINPTYFRLLAGIIAVGGAVPTCRSSAHHPSSGRHRSACASLVNSFPAGVRELALERIAPSHTGVLIANFHRAAPARCGAFADERRGVAGRQSGPPVILSLESPARVGATRNRGAHPESSRTETRNNMPHGLFAGSGRRLPGWRCSIHLAGV